MVWIIIGVSGSGKTVIGRLLSERLECDFLEGDRRHTPANIEKMHRQEPLDDEDRRSWLLALDDDIKRALANHRETVLTCSALKRAYRQQLRLSQRVQIVWIDVPVGELERRLAQRANHYMTIAMLTSQIETFEEITPEEKTYTLSVDGLLSPNQLVDHIIEQMREKFPDLAQPWWQRNG